MTHEAVSWTQHGAANWRGLGSIIAESLLRDRFLEDDRQVEWYAEQFMEGNYTFQRGSPPGTQ